MNTQNALKLTSACYNREPLKGKHALEELPISGKINLRGDLDNESFARGAEKAIGIQLPSQPNTFQQNDALTVYWLGPDEWQLTCKLDSVAAILENIGNHLDGIHHSAVDVSDYSTTLRLSSPEAAGILRRPCPLDLHERVLPAGSIAQTRFGHASVLLHRQSDPNVFDIQVRWSFAEYCWDYLVSTIGMMD
ncbi:MAG: sarcosine oxidase subunit gamma family protein [Pseudomonadota bacterium]